LSFFIANDLYLDVPRLDGFGICETRYEPIAHANGLTEGQGYFNQDGNDRYHESYHAKYGAWMRVIPSARRRNQ